MMRKGLQNLFHPAPESLRDLEGPLSVQSEGLAERGQNGLGTAESLPEALNSIL